MEWAQPQAGEGDLTAGEGTEGVRGRKAHPQNSAFLESEDSSDSTSSPSCRPRPLPGRSNLCPRLTPDSVNEVLEQVEEALQVFFGL